MSVDIGLCQRPVSPTDTVIKKCRICFQTERVPITDTRPLRGKEPPMRTLVEQLVFIMGMEKRHLEEHPDGFVSPCRCAGSMAWVHRSCLRIWRNKSPRRDSFYQCEQCFTPYHFKQTWLNIFLGNRLSILVLTGVSILGAFALGVMLMTMFIPAHFPPFDPTGMMSNYSTRTDSSIISVDGTFMTIESRGWTRKTINRQVDDRKVGDTKAGDTKVGGKNDGSKKSATSTITTPPPPPKKKTSTPTPTPTEKRVPYLEVWDWMLTGAHPDPSENRRILTMVLERGLLDLWPAALSFLAIMALLRDGSQFSCMTAMLILLCTVLMYMFGGTWPLYIITLPLAYGLHSFFFGMHQMVEITVDTFVKWTSSELDNYPQ
jgi:hypothetical protein